MINEQDVPKMQQKLEWMWVFCKWRILKKTLQGKIQYIEFNLAFIF